MAGVVLFPSLDIPPLRQHGGNRHDFCVATRAYDNARALTAQFIVLHDHLAIHHYMGDSFGLTIQPARLAGQGVNTKATPKIEPKSEGLGEGQRFNFRAAA